MDKNEGMIGMALGSWLVAFAGGTLAGTLLWLLAGWSFLQGAFVGLLVFVVAGAVISWIMTRPLAGPNEKRIEAAPSPNAAPPKAEPPKAEPPKAAPPKAAAAPTAPASVQPSKRLPGEEELASRKGSWKYEGEAATKSEPKAAESVATDEARPAFVIDQPDGGQADDLKKISGVGPKLEQTLNDLGIWHFSQVASFTKADIAWVDERLRFKGRIERDDWIGQAKALQDAKG